MDPDYQPRLPQDELDSKDTDVDPVIMEENEDITETLHVDPNERRDIMDENENPDSEQFEDTREEVEDRDQET